MPLGQQEKEASNDPDPPTAKPANPTRQTFGESVETWRPLAEAYHRHHFACPMCISAGKGYGLRCGTGASLWRVYATAPVGPAPGYEQRQKEGPRE